MNLVTTIERRVSNVVPIRVAATRRALRTNSCPASEALCEQDMFNIRRCVSLISDRHTHYKAVSQAVWAAIRQATGVPAPGDFRVADLPLITAELRRIWRASLGVRAAFSAAERILVKRIIRDNEEAEALIEAVHAEVMEAAHMPDQELERLLGALDVGFEAHELRQLLSRDGVHGESLNEVTSW